MVRIIFRPNKGIGNAIQKATTMSGSRALTVHAPEPATRPLQRDQRLLNWGSAVRAQRYQRGNRLAMSGEIQDSPEVVWTHSCFGDDATALGGRNQGLEWDVKLIVKPTNHQ